MGFFSSCLCLNFLNSSNSCLSFSSSLIFFHSSNSCISCFFFLSSRILAVPLISISNLVSNFLLYSSLLICLKRISFSIFICLDNSPIFLSNSFILIFISTDCSNLIFLISLIILSLSVLSSSNLLIIRDYFFNS